MASFKGGNKTVLVVKQGPSAEKIIEALMELSNTEVLVGFPEDTTSRKISPDESQGMTNASIAYIHDNGAPEANIPARPFMIPGIERVAEKIADMAEKIAKKVLAPGGDPQNTIQQGYHSIGLVAQASIRGVINEGIAPPLSAATLRQRAARGRKGAKAEIANRAAGNPPGLQLAKPLIDTGQLRNAVNYVVRSRKKRGK